MISHFSVGVGLLHDPYGNINVIFSGRQGCRPLQNKKEPVHNEPTPKALLNFQYRARYSEVDKKRQRVADGCDQRVRHYRRVKSDLARQKRKTRADQLCHNDRADQGQRYDQSDKKRVRMPAQVEQHKLDKIRRGKRYSAEERHAELLPEHHKHTFELDLSERERADDRYRRLRTGVTAGARDHRDKTRQYYYARKHNVEA